MEMTKYKFNEEQKKEIKAARKETKNKRIDKRLQVLELKSEGTTTKRIEEITGYGNAHIASLVKEYYENGIESIVGNHYKGNRRNMSYEEEEELLRPFIAKAEAGMMVDVAEIEKAYVEKVGHTIGGGQIYYVLKRHGWRKVMPRSRHPKKADDEAIEASKKLKTE